MKDLYLEIQKYHGQSIIPFILKEKKSNSKDFQYLLKEIENKSLLLLELYKQLEEHQKNTCDAKEYRSLKSIYEKEFKTIIKARCQIVQFHFKL